MDTCYCVNKAPCKIKVVNTLLLIQIFCFFINIDSYVAPNHCKLLDFKKSGGEVSRAWWLTPVILPTSKIEIKRIMVQGQPRQKVTETPKHKLSMVVQVCNPSYAESRGKKIAV
jgi:hypothetical protein